MTHINRLEGNAVGGPQPEKMRLLQIYSQPCEHFDAVIVGNKAGLRRLFKTVLTASEGDIGAEVRTDQEVFATDGEGYDVKVILMPDDWNDPKWKEHEPHYCDRGYDDDTHREAVSV